MQPLPEIIQRIYTATPLVGIGIAAIFYLNILNFLLVDTLLIVLIGWEWARLSGYERSTFRYAYLLVLLIACWGVYHSPVEWIARLSIVMGTLVIGHVAMMLNDKKSMYYPNELLAILGVVYLPLAWYALFFLKSSTPIYLGIGLLIIVLTDTLAYVVGKRWGRHPIAPDISPNKTWEGFLAGLCGPLCILLIIDRISGYPFYITFKMASVVIFTTLAAIAGDLFESAVKRQIGLKDSGDGLPGHGGWLDRFDSLVCAMPVFLAGLLYLATI